MIDIFTGERTEMGTDGGVRMPSGNDPPDDVA